MSDSVTQLLPAHCSLLWWEELRFEGNNGGCINWEMRKRHRLKILILGRSVGQIVNLSCLNSVSKMKSDGGDGLHTQEPDPEMLWKGFKWILRTGERYRGRWASDKNKLLGALIWIWKQKAWPKRKIFTWHHFLINGWRKINIWSPSSRSWIWILLPFLSP